MRIIEGEYDDRPLDGPWNRRRPATPPGNEEGAGAPPEREVKAGRRGDGVDLPIPGPESRRREADPDPPVKSAEPAPSGEGTGGDEGYFTPGRGKANYTAAESGEAVAEKKGPPGEDISVQAPETAIKKLFSPSGLYAGIIMAEVLGSRGGRFGRR